MLTPCRQQTDRRPLHTCRPVSKQASSQSVLLLTPPTSSGLPYRGRGYQTWPAEKTITHKQPPQPEDQAQHSSAVHTHDQLDKHVLQTTHGYCCRAHFLGRHAVIRTISKQHCPSPFPPSLPPAAASASAAARVRAAGRHSEPNEASPAANPAEKAAATSAEGLCCCCCITAAAQEAEGIAGTGIPEGDIRLWSGGAQQRPKVRGQSQHDLLVGRGVGEQYAHTLSIQWRLQAMLMM